LRHGKQVATEDLVGFGPASSSFVWATPSRMYRVPKDILDDLVCFAATLASGLVEASSCPQGQCVDQVPEGAVREDEGSPPRGPRPKTES
jgi:hypothetical protein